MKNTDPAEAINAFLENFGNKDIYTQIVLEEFFKELFNEQGEELSVHLSGEAEQKGNKSN